ncbi:MAG TPA: 6,7-dimethyl-8-ribityllumazine synthase [Gammaproteobacteria bacterium]|nr:6,7-dimethyl-8-ribityllumazine synthase [Gammaproteobacteria bacterium]
MPVITEKPLTSPARLALVVSRFNEEITSKLLAGAEQRLEAYAGTEATVVWVPGAIEIPLLAQRLAKSGNYDAIIALGAVIRGETSHYDYVCQQVSDGCQKVALDSNIPVIFGVLTTDDEVQALARVGGNHGHKGVEAVDVAFAMISVLRQLI